jgi:rfaE bifunctional protein kinase chain/domain
MISRLQALIERGRNQTVAVIGDLIADEFIYGQLSRVSREAPVLILKYDSTTILPGGAGNAAANVAALGAKAKLVGLVGRGEVDRRLVRSFPRGVDRSNLLRPIAYRVPVKTRILAGGLHSTRQQIVRIDRDPTSFNDTQVIKDFERLASKVLIGCDAILISDYGTGLVTPRLIKAIRKQSARLHRRRPIPIIIDSRYRLLSYPGVTACTPNESEVEQMLGVTIGDDQRALERAGRTLLKKMRSKGVVITRGSQGMAVFEPGQKTVNIPIYGTDEVADVTGAGDTVIATVTLALAAGASLYEAASLANYAGGLVVMKRGTAIVSSDELLNAIQADLSD